MLMKTRNVIYGILSLFILAVSCRDEDKILRSEFIVVNEVNGQGNVSIYSYPDKNLIEQFFTINSPFKQPIEAAVKDGKNLYISSRAYYDNTGYWKSKLRKIDLTSGTQIQEVDSWIEPQKEQFISYKGNLVLSYGGYHYNTVQNYFSCVKIYDENLILKDSITEDNVSQMRASTIANNRLFSHVIVRGIGSFIKVLDLSTKVVISSIEVPLFKQLVYLNENQLLVSTVDSYFILDTKTLEKSQPISSYLDDQAVAYSPVDNTLYTLFVNAQPALTAYRLGKINLLTGESSNLTDESIIGPIIFDDKTNVIVSGGGLKIFSTEGKVLQTVDLPYSTSHILIK